MKRTIFETHRTLEFFTEKELSMQIGAARESWPVTIIKELVDNALDAVLFNIAGEAARQSERRV